MKQTTKNLIAILILFLTHFSLFAQADDLLEKMVLRLQDTERERCNDLGKMRLRLPTKISDSANPLYNRGHTPLMLAAAWGRPDIVRSLIVLGSGVGIQNHKGNTALILAAACGEHPEIVQTLIDAGANVDHLNNRGNTALMLATYWGHLETVRTLIDAGADVNNLHHRYQAILAELAEYSENGQHVSFRNAGDTPLILAAYRGHLEIVQTLIDAGADVNLQSNRGNTALKIAIGHGHTEIEEALIAAGANR